MNLSVQDTGGDVLIVSQFTLHGNIKKETDPPISGHQNLILPFLCMKNLFGKQKRFWGKVGTGIFGAMMDVSLVNEVGRDTNNRFKTERLLTGSFSEKNPINYDKREYFIG